MSDERHVIPADDLVEHDARPDCACGPTAERVVRDDAGDGWIYVHHSLDGRELKPPPDGGIRMICSRRLPPAV